MTLRQFRTETVIAALALVVLVIVLAVSHVNVANVNRAFLISCRAAGDCSSASNPVVGVDTTLQNALVAIVTATPALVGLFFGAPLVARELESGTFRLAWTQSVTRRRWLAVKLGVVAIAAMVIGGLVTWLADWWASPIDAANRNQFGVATFGLHGVAPLGYAVFAVALGVTTGVVLRRTVAAMAVTLVGFAAARVAVALVVRRHLFAPLHESLPLTDAMATPGFGVQQPEGLVSLNPPTVEIPNGWVYSTTIVNSHGGTPSSSYLLHACPVLTQIVNAGPGSPPGEIGAIGATGGAKQPAGTAFFEGCLQKLSTSFHTVVTFQPASRFWPFQWAETGVFLGGAFALAALTYWWLRRQYV